MKNTILTLIIIFSANINAQSVGDATIEIQTTEGTITLQLDGRRAPITVKNFLKLINSEYFTNTLFHRVIPNFMIQGGGFDQNLSDLESQSSIPNESGNGLTNLRGTIAMARTSDPHSANAQFFINTKDNSFLNPKSGNWGYAVFGNVIKGMDIVDRISKKPTGPKGRFSEDVPIEEILIQKIVILDN
ncbi:peptidylprolyl isomerase [Woeseiaceae bacterium]|nr:peptidylprolyl isomerase [Woeseiaceae bacterium]